MSQYRSWKARIAVAVLSGLLGLLAISQIAIARTTPIQRVISPGGIEAWLIRDQKNPIIAIGWSFEGGAALDPPDRLGLAYMASSLLDEGAGPFDSQAFQRQLEDASITLGFAAGRDNFSGYLVTLRDRRDTAFDLARLAITQPRFDADAIERIRSQILASLKRKAGSPENLAYTTFNATVFPDHPYGRPADGTPETVAAITRDSLVQFIHSRFGRDRLKVAVSGDITAKELGAALDRIFGDLPAKAGVPDVSETVPGAAGKTLVLDLPIPQTIVVLGQAGLKRSDPDWYAASILNYVLGGGGFTSRLMSEVREKRGLTYGVGTDLQPMRHSALILASAAIVNAKAGEALDVIRQVWGQLARDGITDQELADAKTYLTGSFPLNMTSNSAIAAVLLQIQRDGLGIDYLDRRDALFNAVTLDDIKRVAARLLNADQLTTVAVGAPVGIKASQ